MAGIVTSHRVSPEYKRQVESMTLVELMTYFKIKLSENEELRKKIADASAEVIDPIQFNRLKQELLACMERINDLHRLHKIFDQSRKEEMDILRPVPQVDTELDCDRLREVISDCLSLTRDEMLKTQLGTILIRCPYLDFAKERIGLPFVQQCRKGLATLLSKTMMIKSQRRHMLFEDPKGRLIVIIPVSDRNDLINFIRNYILDFIPQCKFHFSVPWTTHVVCGACLWEPRTFPVILEGGSRRAKKMDSTTFSTKMEEAILVAEETMLEDICYLVSNIDSETTLIRSTDPAILEERKRAYQLRSDEDDDSESDSPSASKRSSYLTAPGALSRGTSPAGGISTSYDTEGSSRDYKAKVDLMSAVALKRLRERDRLGAYGAALLSRREQELVNPLYEYVWRLFDDVDETQGIRAFKRIRNFVRKRVREEKKARGISDDDGAAGMDDDNNMESDENKIIVGELFNFQRSTKGNGDTLLMACLRKRLTLCAEYMCHEQTIRDGLDFSLQNNDGYTALMMAVEFGASIDLTKLIYTLTSSPRELTNEKGQNILDLATALGKGEEWLKLLSTDPSALDEPAEETKEEEKTDEPAHDQPPADGGGGDQADTGGDPPAAAAATDASAADGAGDSAVGMSLGGSESSVKPPAEMDSL